MPATYAHFRFGQQVREMVSQETKDIINKYPQLYLIGVHGSDILFFYKPYLKNRISELGHNIHRTPGMVFFLSARDRIEQIKDIEEKEKCLAYVFGVLAHYAMDISCHGIVFHDQKRLNLSHTEIESEFDRVLLEQDGKVGYLTPLVNHLVASKENAVVIQKFYPKTTVSQIQASIKGMIFYGKLLLAPGKLKRNLIFAVMRILGIYPNVHGHVMNYSENPAYKETTEKLVKQYPIAIECAKRLFLVYEKCLKHEGELSDEFKYDFEANYHQ